MAKVVRKQYQNGEYEDLESMLRRFKRKVNDELILNEIKKREFYLSPSQKKRKKREEAEQRRRKAERMQKESLHTEVILMTIRSLCIVLMKETTNGMV